MSQQSKMPQVPLYSLSPMGMAVIDQNNRAHLYSSDRPYKHLSEAQNLKNLLQQYLSSGEGKQFVNYLHSKGRKFMEVKGVGSADLDNNAVAAVMRNDLEGVILANYNGQSFSSRVSEMAGEYGVKPELMEEYVLTHELAHAAGCRSETQTEGLLKEYFSERASRAQGGEKVKYLSLAKIAGQRLDEMKKGPAYS